MRFLNVQPSCCLDVVVSMLNCVIWRHILLEIEFKSRGDMGSDSIAQRYHPSAAAQLSTSKKKKKENKKTEKSSEANLYLRHALRADEVISYWDRWHVWLPNCPHPWFYPVKQLIHAPTICSQDIKKLTLSIELRWSLECFENFPR